MATYAELGTSTFHSIPPPNLATVTRKEMLDYLENTWGIEETLFSGLKSEESYMMTANPLRRPLIFYYAHTAVSYVNKMLLAGICPERLNPAFESLFAVGVDEMSWDDADLNTNCHWPSVEEVRGYREQVYNMVSETIKTIDYKLPVRWNDPVWSIFMGFEHHRIHIETSSVLMHELPVDRVVRPKAWIDAPTFGEPPKNEFVPVSEGVVRYGKDRDFPSYGWDNEYGFKEVQVPSFSATKFLITNREFLEFVKTGGYENEHYWTTEGWKWCRSMKSGKRHPHFWIPEGEGFKYRAMWDVREMPWDWPAEVNFHEAKAYCNWKGPEYRVITEAEWHRIRDSSDAEGVEHDVVYSGIEHKANIQLVYGSSSPVNMFPPTKTGFYDVHGNVWEWGEDFFYGLPGFETHELYDDFSTPCFDSEHNMMFGGSWIATGDEASIYARFAFRRHFFQHLGFRLVKSTNPLPANSESARPNPTYETDKVVAQYMLFHYGAPELNLPFNFGPTDALDFPVRIAQECMRVTKGHEVERALDLGCSVGRSVFEMAKDYKQVLGIDFSARFISCGCRLKEHGSLEYSVLEEGDAYTKHVATIESEIDRSRVDFKQGDACNLPHFIGTFDLILMSNLIDRLATPMACLQRLPSLVNPHGYVVISSPYTWLEEFTPKSNWLGGGGEGSLVALKEVMEKNGFALLEVKELPFFMREHRRKYQWVVSQMTVWQKK